jgi:lysophospholipase L1-like esterase
MRRLLSAVATATLVVSMVQMTGPVAQAGGVGPSYYLALGTSIGIGFQPGQGATQHGYVDDLFGRMQQQIPGLVLHNVSCRGETSWSMITGMHSACHHAAGSQLDAAVAFLTAHPGAVPFITIDVGANDLIARCAQDSGLVAESCANDLRPHLERRLRHIVDDLQAAGPGIPIVVMTYYNPLLGFWGLVPGGMALARADQRAWVVLNDALTSAATDAGVAVADVAATFQIDNFVDTGWVPGRGQLPVNVALTCRWTWFCRVGDVHANNTGYEKIGGTYYRELVTLLP